MYISEIQAEGFRCFSAEAPLQLHLRRGLNVLVGPNDAGKTAILDAPRYVLWTRGDDYVRLEASDFHSKADGSRATELLIRCTFEGLSPDEESRFMEWCTNEAGTLRLHVCLRGTRRPLPGGGDSVSTQYRAGRDADGMPLEGELREYLKTTYLRPLRDAERELRPGRRSRLSRILGALPDMAPQAQAAASGQPPTLHDVMAATENSVNTNTGVQTVQTNVNSNYLKELSFSNDLLTATLGLGAKGSFDQILERLELYLNASDGRSEKIARGLGYNNLLFMAAELLLLQSHPEQAPFLLIEEPEAHLHPQHQALFMQLLADKTAEGDLNNGYQHQIQVLLTTHSPHLASNADLEAVTMVIGHKTYSLGKSNTKLDGDDYSFLRRFLDATKANLFFARGLILVEGDAENLLLPAVARKIGKSLSKSGVSIVNVGHRGLFRYSRIFQRSDGSSMPIPIALIPDRDIPPDSAKPMVGDRLTETEWEDTKKTTHLENLKKDAGGSVQAFPSEQWTLEFDLACKPGLVLSVHQAILLAKGAAGKTKQEIMDGAKTEIEQWRAQGKTDEAIAGLVFENLYKKRASKAETAEWLARIIDNLEDTHTDFRAKLPPYLAQAIDYATSLGASSAPPAQAPTSSGDAG